MDNDELWPPREQLSIPATQIPVNLCVAVITIALLFFICAGM